MVEPEPTELDPETLDLVTKLCQKNPDVLNMGNLSNYSNLPVLVQETILKDGFTADVLINNRVPNNLAIPYLNEYFSKDTPYQERFVIEAVIKYNDLGLLKELSKTPRIFRSLLKGYPKWKDLLGVQTATEAIEHIYANYKDPKEVIEHLISNVYLDEESIDYLIKRSKPDAYELFRRQYLTEAQLIKLDRNLWLAWCYYPLSDPDKYRPQWTNKGDPDMIGPNMPDDWAEQILTSKKDTTLKQFAKFGPQKYLPLLIGKEAKKTWYNFSEIIQARLSGNKELCWDKVFHDSYI